jgi:methionine--tRNA ligase beta chain
VDISSYTGLSIYTPETGYSYAIESETYIAQMAAIIGSGELSSIDESEYMEAASSAPLTLLFESRNAGESVSLLASPVSTYPKLCVETPEGCALIGIEDFMNVELRTAKILSAERVPKAKKLLKLQVDLGYEQRQVVSGIAKFYEPEALIGKKVILVTNLKPAVLCGIESNGMILASGEDTIRVVFLDPETPLGERIR